MSTAAPSLFGRRSAVGRLPRASAIGLAGVAALVLLAAVISAPAGPGCGLDDAGTGDVVAVGNYPRPLTFGNATLLPEQLVFADVVAKRTRWDLWVIRAQVFNEMNGAHARERVAARNFNWLNVSYDDALMGRGRLDGMAVWRDPVRAGNATADWIQGKRATLGEQGRPSIRDAYRRGATTTPAEAIALLQRSGWASSGYPALPGIYRAMAQDRGGAQRPTLAMASSASAGCEATPSTTGVAGAGAIAEGLLGATSPKQMPGFTGAFPVGQWCSWFVTNVLRKAGVTIPVYAYSGAPYTWAAQHRDDWTLFKPLGRPAIGPTPPVGSLVAYKAGGGGSPTSSDHINLVSRTHGDGTFDIVGGNQGSGCPNGSCVSAYKACRLTGWRTSREPRLDCGDTRPIWSIVSPHRASGGRA